MQRLPVVRCGGKTIPANSEAMYLDVLLDSKLGFILPISNAFAKAAAKEAAMQKALSMAKGYSKPARITTRYHHSIMLAIASYRCTAFSHALDWVVAKQCAAIAQWLTG